MKSKPNGLPERTKHQKPSGIRQDPVVDIMSTKLVEALIPTARSSQDKTTQPPVTMAREVTSRTASARIDAANIKQVLPDMELAEDITVSSILSPNDMISVRLTYDSEADDLGEIKSRMTAVMEDFWENDYKINKKLEPWLRETLWVSGANPIIILPESTIDDIINSNSRVSTESLKFSSDFNLGEKSIKPLGFLKNPKKPEVAEDGFNYSFEGINIYKPDLSQPVDYNPVMGMGVLIHDNFNVLKLPSIQEKASLEARSDILSHRKMSLENYAGLEDADKQHRVFYRQRSFKQSTVIQVKTLDELDRPTKGHPVDIVLPSEACIPVIVPTEPDRIVGAYLALDMYGNFIQVIEDVDYFTQLSNNQSAMRDMNSQLMAQIKRAQDSGSSIVSNNTNTNMALAEQARVYGEVLEYELSARLDAGGVFKKGVKVTASDTLMRVMLSRAFQRMTTQLVFIPESLLVYMAFDRNQFGVGVSLVDKTKIIASLRAILLFTNNRAAIKNGVQHNKVTITHDPDDPNPDERIEQVMHDFIRFNHLSNPVGMVDPNDIAQFLARAGTAVVSTGTDAYPEFGVDVEQISANNVAIDTELMDNLKRTHLQGIGVPPEIAELSDSIEFATQAISSNILFSKKCMLRQIQYSEMLTEFMYKYTCNSSILMQKLRDQIKPDDLATIRRRNPNIHVDDIVYYYLSKFNTGLPKPDIAKLEMQLKSFENFNQLVDACIPAFISSDIFDNALVGELGNSIPATIAVLKAALQRDFIRANNILPEINELVNPDNKNGAGFDLLATHESHINSLSKSLLSFMKDVMIRKQQTDQTLNKLGEITGQETPDASNVGGGDSGGEGEDNNAGGDNNEDPFGGDFDLGGGEGDNPEGEGDEGSPAEGEGEEPKEPDANKEGEGE